MFLPTKCIVMIKTLKKILRWLFSGNCTTKTNGTSNKAHSDNKGLPQHQLAPKSRLIPKYFSGSPFARFPIYDYSEQNDSSQSPE
jgi:hypothetical protein